MKRPVTQYYGRVRVRFFVVILTYLTLLGGCGSPETAPQEQLRQWLKAGQAAAENKERGDLLELISPAYADSRGHERDDIGDILRVYFFRQHSISLLTKIEEIRVYGDSAAEIELTVAMAGQNDSALGFSADAYRFQLELEREGEEWFLISARWGELGKELH